jgi:hypothetical protein
MGRVAMILPNRQRKQVWERTKFYNLYSKMGLYCRNPETETETWNWNFSAARGKAVISAYAIYPCCGFQKQDVHFGTHFALFAC